MSPSLKCTFSASFIRLSTHKFRPGFALSGNGTTYTFYCKNMAERDQWIKHLSKIGVLGDIAKSYTFGKQLGKGNFSGVSLAVKKSNNETYAIKSINKSKILSIFNSVESEINLLRSLNHPNIVKLCEVYEDDLYVHLVLEYLAGGELFHLSKKKVLYTEQEVLKIIKPVMEALRYLHSKNIVHRDIKPGNLMFCKPESTSTTKIIDFGLATVVNPKVPERLRCGSPGYIAPEVLNSLGYGSKADVFSMGIILYNLLSGAHPFYSRNPKEMLERNKKGDVTFMEPKWALISPAACNLLKLMLAKSPENRISADQALSHPWFQLNGTLGKQGEMQIYKTLKKLDVPSKADRVQPQQQHGSIVRNSTPLIKPRKFSAEKTVPYSKPPPKNGIIATNATAAGCRCVTHRTEQDEDPEADFDELEMNEGMAGIYTEPNQPFVNKPPSATPGPAKNRRTIIPFSSVPYSPGYMSHRDAANNTKSSYFMNLSKKLQKTQQQKEEQPPKKDKDESDDFYTAKSHQSIEGVSYKEYKEEEKNTKSEDKLKVRSAFKKYVNELSHALSSAPLKIFKGNI